MLDAACLHRVNAETESLMTRKHVKDRRARNLELGKQDAANRCTSCRRGLPKIGVLMMLTPSGETIRYCNETCRQDHIDALLTVEARR